MPHARFGLRKGFHFHRRLGVPVPPRRRVARRAGEHAGQFEIEIILIFANDAGLLIRGLMFVLKYPQSLGGEPFGRQRRDLAPDGAIDGQQRRILRGHDLSRLGCAPLIHPQQAGSEGFVLRIQRHDGTTRRVETNGSDSIQRRKVQRFQRLLTRLLQTPVPIVGILFGPTGVGMRRGIRHGTGLTHHLTRDGVKTTGPNGFGAAIDAQNEQTFLVGCCRCCAGILVVFVVIVAGLIHILGAVAVVIVDAPQLHQVFSVILIEIKVVVVVIVFVGIVEVVLIHTVVAAAAGNLIRSFTRILIVPFRLAVPCRGEPRRKEGWRRRRR
mmetsp:Transcript_5216/g.13153  ORF Transcript_5216/g.13153 Transcript_5216/m.13153 type:complete len:326 (-) Transcript_5216:120-1097(-)